MALVLLVDFQSPYLALDHRVATRLWNGKPFRLCQTWHRMAEDIRHLLDEQVCLPMPGAQSRPLEAEEIALFERILAPLAEVGTALPSDAFTQRLWGTMQGTAVQTDRFASIETMLAAWGDPHAVALLKARIAFELEGAWRQAFLRSPSIAVTTWMTQLACLLTRPEDFRKRVACEKAA